MKLFLKTKILLVFVSIIVVTIIVSLFSLSRQNSSTDSILFLNQKILKPIEKLKIVSDLYAIDIVDTSHKVRNKNISFSEGLSLVHNAKIGINKNWDEFSQIDSIELNKTILDDTKKIKFDLKRLFRN